MTNLTIHHVTGNRTAAPEFPGLYSGHVCDAATLAEEKRSSLAVNLWAQSIPVLPALIAEATWDRYSVGGVLPAAALKSSNHDGLDSPWRDLAAAEREARPSYNPRQLSDSAVDRYLAPYRARVERYETAIAAGLPILVTLHRHTGEFTSPQMVVAVNEDGSRGAIVDYPSRPAQLLSDDEAEGFVLGSMRNAL